MSHVHIVATRIVVSQSQVPLVVLGGHIPTSGGHTPTYGVSHGTSYGPQYA